MKNMSERIKEISVSKTVHGGFNSQYTGKLRIVNSRGFKGRSISDKSLNQYQEKNKEPMPLYYYQ